MAGGSGTRFWPRSTRDEPKQFLKLFGERSMLQATADRLNPLVPPERIWVITNQRYEKLVRQQLPEVPGRQVVGEPVGRNTAPCVALAAALLKQKDPEATMIVLPADHLIGDPDEFRSVLGAAASKTGNDPQGLITIGIRPDHPETGYGYIEYLKGEKCGETEGHPVCEVKRFREKPDRQTARSFLESGNFLWNSGMFVWKAGTILRRFGDHLPQVGRLLGPLQDALEDGETREGITAFYEKCPSISIDYGIMEKADRVWVIPGDFRWNDVGSWSAVFELREKDGQGNVVRTENLLAEDSSGNLVHSESGKMIALVGMENTAVVETEDAILVCRLDRAQDVKQIVKRLEEDEMKRRYL